MQLLKVSLIDLIQNKDTTKIQNYLYMRHNAAYVGSEFLEGYLCFIDRVNSIDYFNETINYLNRKQIDCSINSRLIMNNRELKEFLTVY